MAIGGVSSLPFAGHGERLHATLYLPPAPPPRALRHARTPHRCWPVHPTCLPRGAALPHTATFAPAPCTTAHKIDTISFGLPGLNIHHSILFFSLGHVRTTSALPNATSAAFKHCRTPTDYRFICGRYLDGDNSLVARGRGLFLGGHAVLTPSSLLAPAPHKHLHSYWFRMALVFSICHLDASYLL